MRKIPPGQFIEIGPGSGEITQLLLDLGWSGCSYDLEEKTIETLKVRFSQEIAEQRFKPIHEDFILSQFPGKVEKVDLVISSMVMEHLEDDTQRAFMDKSDSVLRDGGRRIGLVPASPRHWGIEDDIAGHYRRYTRVSIDNLLAASNWKLSHIAGLTFPISNILLPVSNFLVNRSERSKLTLSPLERTKQSGRRNVKFKTYFPNIFGFFLNEIYMLPIYLLQILFRTSEKCLVLYFEAAPKIFKSKQ